MARDTDRELERLEKLLAREEELDKVQWSGEVADGPEEEALPVQCPVHNSDRTDTDLEDYSRQVYEPPAKKRGCCLPVTVCLLIALALALGWLALRLGGLIG